MKSLIEKRREPYESKEDKSRKNFLHKVSACVNQRVAWKDEKIADYWYKIPEYLEYWAASVFVTNQDAFNTYKIRVEQAASEFGEFLREQKCDKVNLVLKNFACQVKFNAICYIIINPKDDVI